MLWFLLGLVAGGVLGMMLLAITAKEADESFVIPKEQAQTGEYFWTGECFWCEECMLKTSNDAYVCPVCGWRYRGREGE